MAVGQSLATFTLLYCELSPFVIANFPPFVIANFPPFVIANAVKQSGVALVGHRERSVAIYGWLPPRVEIAASLRSSQ